MGMGRSPSFDGHLVWAFPVCKRVSTFNLFWSEIGYGFRENYGSVWTHLSLQFQINKKEIEICELEMLFKTSFVCALI